MSNETKRDVFDRLLKEHCKTILDLNPASAETDVKQIVENVFRDRYAAALPDDLPVIPKAVSELIMAHKRAHLPMSHVMGAVGSLALMRTEPSGALAWVKVHEDAFAIAWLLSVWRVEETGEVVKL